MSTVGTHSRLHLRGEGYAGNSRVPLVQPWDIRYVVSSIPHGAAQGFMIFDPAAD